MLAEVILRGDDLPEAASVAASDSGAFFLRIPLSGVGALDTPGVLAGVAPKRLRVGYWHVAQTHVSQGSYQTKRYESQ